MYLFSSCAGTGSDWPRRKKTGSSTKATTRSDGAFILHIHSSCLSTWEHLALTPSSTAAGCRIPVRGLRRNTGRSSEKANSKRCGRWNIALLLEFVSFLSLFLTDLQLSFHTPGSEDLAGCGKYWYQRRQWSTAAFTKMHLIMDALP